jgi:hypothetical protein
MVDRKEPLPTMQPDQEVATSIIERASSLSSSSDNLPPQELADNVKDGQPAPSGSTRGDKPDGISPNATTGNTANLILQLRRETGDLLYTEKPGGQLQLHSYGRSQWRRRGTAPRGHM